jgi:hypothetical protein
MEMFCFGIFAGMIIAVIFIAGGALYARNTERSNGVDSDIRVYVPSRNRDRGGNQSDHLGLDDEAVKNILMGMRMSTRYCDTERLAIDYCLDRLEAENG